MARKASSESRRRVVYVLAGAVMGIAVMVVPALCLPSSSWTAELGGLPLRFTWDTVLPAAYAATSPLEVLAEVLWLILPALIVILALYWLAVHRTRWAGYDEAAKWSRR